MRVTRQEFLTDAPALMKRCISAHEPIEVVDGTGKVVGIMSAPAAPDFDGDGYAHEYDHARLTGQLAAIRDLMIDGAWRTLGEIEAATKAPAASVSAQLRNLRKERFGSHTVEKRARGDRATGLFEYRVLAKGGAL